MSWRQVKIETNYRDTGKPYSRRLTEQESMLKATQWIRAQLGTVDAAKQAQQAHRDWQAGKVEKTPEAERWVECVAFVRSMERRYEDLGIQLARVERVDFSGVGREISRDEGIER